jgi:hypothetical protein
MMVRIKIKLSSSHGLDPDHVDPNECDDYHNFSLLPVSTTSIKLFILEAA